MNIKKRFIILGDIFLSILLVWSLFYECSWNVQEQSLLELPYRTDTKTLQTTFPTLKEGFTCYWKTGVISNTASTPMFITGFIVLEETQFETLLEQYEWEMMVFEFPNGIDPMITSFSLFDFRSNKEFTNSFLPYHTSGTILLDIKNGILYLNVDYK